MKHIVVSSTYRGGQQMAGPDVVYRDDSAVCLEDILSQRNGKPRRHAQCQDAPAGEAQSGPKLKHE